MPHYEESLKCRFSGGGKKVNARIKQNGRALRRARHASAKE
jgi:hypothetical protein